MKNKIYLYILIMTFGLTIWNPVKAGAELPMPSSAFTDEYIDVVAPKVEVAPEVEVTSSNQNQTETIYINKKLTYQIHMPELTTVEKNLYESLTSEEKEKFHESRRLKLKYLAQALALKDIPLGYVISLKNKIVSKVTGKEKVQLAPEVKSGILAWYHEFLWRSAGQFSKDFDKKGVSIIIGAKLQGGIGKFGGGIARYLAFDIAYDKANKNLIMRIDKQKEIFNGGLAADAVFVAKFFVYKKKSHKTTEAVEKGYAIYPPSVPYVGYGGEVGPERISKGIYVSGGAPDLLSFGFAATGFEKETISIRQYQRDNRVTANLINTARKILSKLGLINGNNANPINSCGLTFS